MTPLLPRLARDYAANLRAVDERDSQLVLGMATWLLGPGASRIASRAAGGLGFRVTLV